MEELNNPPGSCQTTDGRSNTKNQFNLKPANQKPSTSPRTPFFTTKTTCRKHDGTANNTWTKLLVNNFVAYRPDYNADVAEGRQPCDGFAGTHGRQRWS